MGLDGSWRHHRVAELHLRPASIRNSKRGRGASPRRRPRSGSLVALAPCPPCPLARQPSPASPPCRLPRPSAPPAAPGARPRLAPPSSPAPDLASAPHRPPPLGQPPGRSERGQGQDEAPVGRGSGQGGPRASGQKGRPVLSLPGAPSTPTHPNPLKRSTSRAASPKRGIASKPTACSSISTARRHERCCASGSRRRGEAGALSPRGSAARSRPPRTPGAP